MTRIRLRNLFESTVSEDTLNLNRLFLPINIESLESQTFADAQAEAV